MKIGLYLNGYLAAARRNQTSLKDAHTTREPDEIITRASTHTGTVLTRTRVQAVIHGGDRGPFAPLSGKPPRGPAALRVFERCRFRRTAWITRESLRYGQMAQWQHAAAVRIRDVLLRATPAAFTRATMRRMMAFDA